MADELQGSATLINQKVMFSGTAGDNPPIIIDYVPPIGDGQGYTPLQLILVSLASCSGSTVASLLRKMRKTVSEMTVNARGIRREQHPLSFQRISLEFILTSPDAGAADIMKAIRLSEETYCPVWAMLKNNVEITFDVRVKTLSL